MRSLEAFIECNGQWERAARRALLPPPHAALPDPPRRGADRPLAGLRARPHRLLARAARARDRSFASIPAREDRSEGRRPHRDQDGRVPRRADAGGRARAGRARPRGASIQAGAGEGSAIADDEYTAQGARDPARRRGGVRRGRHDRQGQGAAAAGGRAARAAPHAVHLPAPRARPRADARAGGVGRDLRRLRDGRGRAAAGCRCWRR